MKRELLRRKIKWLTALGVVVLMGCIEEFDAEIVNFEGALVVDARLNDQVAQQTIWLSRTFSFEETDPSPVRNAQVTVFDDAGASFGFSEAAPGQYRSNAVMQMLPDREYRLEIVTSEGARFESRSERMPAPVTIGDMHAERRTSGTGTEGVSILLDNDSSSGTPTYFRYEYDETFKIIAPDFNPFDWDEVDYDYFCEDDDGWEATVAPRGEEARTCFGNNRSIDLILASTEDLSSNGLQDFEVRFLGRENYFISHRYSILVKQYHHSADAASFFNTMLSFSSSESIFSNVQTGLLEGNISASNSEGLVIGYFELSAYSEKRMFFDYEDLFPGEPLPPYAINCEFIGKPPLYPEGFHVTEIDGKLVIDGTSNSPLLDGIIAGLIGFVGVNENYLNVDEDGELDRAPYLVKALGCVDCREFGSNVVPEFWIEEP
ncbi:DUF4249 domain-containing protein [Flagellimonas sp. DF-77]|uniref:DUF4249 domain-containing protein n=1 Tax=Flagellimonas algarum TaxID=3230298 RepID=UPI003391C77D